MREKTRTGALFRRSLAAALALTLLAGLIRAGAETGEETEYIVKYKASVLRLMDADRPFEVVDEAHLARLLEADLVEWYEPDGTAYLLDPLPDGASLQGAISPWYADEMWHLDMIGAEAAYELDAVGQGVRVAVIDSGANPHPDLEGRLETGWNYLRQNNSSGDSNGHGTGVCGLIAGGGESGMVGTAPKATLIPLKCFEGTTTKVSLVCQAIWGAVDDYDCDVINLSVGIPDSSVALEEAVAHAVENGVIVVAAAGNGGTRIKHYPAAYPEVIGVGNVDCTGTVYKTSNHNESVLLTAPGTEVPSLDFLGGYDTFTGCSFSAPLVTGAVADLLSLEPGLTRQEVFTILSETATDRGRPGWDEYYGWGILNLRGCVLALSPGSGFRISLPWTQDGRRFVSAVNRTEAETSCFLIFAAYDGDGRQTSVSVTPLLLPAKGRETVELPGGTDKAFLCGEDLRPLTPPLELPSE